jgi:hypothetical protein
MTRLRPALIAAVTLAALPLAPLAADPQQGDVATEAEGEATPSEGGAELAKLLEGRIAGKPTSCIRSLPNQRVRTIEGTAYVYGSGGTIWVQRTRDPESIDDRDTLIINRFSGSQLCRFDMMTTVDRMTGFFTGVVLFEDFVPYTRKPSLTKAEG